MREQLEGALGPVLSEVERGYVLDILGLYSELFHLPGEALGCTDQVEYHIEVKGASPIWCVGFKFTRGAWWKRNSSECWVSSLLNP